MTLDHHAINALIAEGRRIGARETTLREDDASITIRFVRSHPPLPVLRIPLFDCLRPRRLRLHAKAS